MIELNQVQVKFHAKTPNEFIALNNIELSVAPGEFVTLLGGNGAGKSTLMNILAGEIPVSQGTIHIDKKNVTKWSTERRSAFVARIFQDPMLGTFSQLTIEENLCIAFKRGNRRGLKRSNSTTLRRRFQELLVPLQMGLEERLTHSVACLSGGQRQALSLIMATLQQAKVLLLDEHTAALDPKTARIIMNLTEKIIKEHNLTVIMITHNMADALQYGSRTILLSQGKLKKEWQDQERSLLTSHDLLMHFDEYNADK